MSFLLIRTFIDPNNIRKLSSDGKHVIELEIDMINVKIIKLQDSGDVP